MKFLGFVWKMLPANYRWQIAIKKASYTVAKLAVAGLVAVGVGGKVDPEHLRAFEEILALMLAGGLELVHDWAKLKFPSAKWL